MMFKPSEWSRTVGLCIDVLGRGLVVWLEEVIL